MRLEKLLPTLALALAPLATAAGQAASDTASRRLSLTLVGLDGRERVVTPAQLAGMARYDTAVAAHRVTGRFSGPRLTDVLALIDASRGDSLRGRALATYVQVQGADGYRVVFALAELDPSFTDRLVILADRKDGAPLDEDEGPYRLIVPGEKRPARWVRQVVRIALMRAP